jgi:hypothetical protein
MLDSKSTVLYLAREGMNAAAMDQDLFATLDCNAMSYLTVTHILRDTLFGHENLPAQEPTVDPNPPTIDVAITQVLSGEPFASVRQLDERTSLPKRTVSYAFATTLGFAARHPCWVPHGLS